MLTIYGDRISGNCLKVVYVAHALDLLYQWVDVDIMRGETRSESFVAMNPAGQVPVVGLGDGRYLAQSNAIMLHLAADSRLIPEDGFLRAKMLEWLFWEQYSHEPYVAVCRFQKLYLGRTDDELDPERVERGQAALRLLDTRLAGRDWLVGDRLTLADVGLLAYSRLAPEGGFDLGPLAALGAWIARCETALEIERVDFPAR